MMRHAGLLWFSPSFLPRVNVALVLVTDCGCAWRPCAVVGTRLSAPVSGREEGLSARITLGGIRAGIQGYFSGRGPRHAKQVGNRIYRAELRPRHVSVTCYSLIMVAKYWATLFPPSLPPVVKGTTMMFLTSVDLAILVARFVPVVYPHSAYKAPNTPAACPAWSRLPRQS